MATSINGSENVSELLRRIQSVSASSPNVLQDQIARASLLQLSRELTANLEQPDELVSNIAFSVRLSGNPVRLSTSTVLTEYPSKDDIWRFAWPTI